MNAPPLKSRKSNTVKTETGLRQALAEPGFRRVTLGNSIKLTKPLLHIPTNVEIVPGLSCLVKGDPNAKISHYGQMDVGPVPVFVGFAPRDIYGTFGGRPKRPENWWNDDPQRDDVPIQCAVSSTPRYASAIGHVVELSAVTYHVSRPIDMGGTHTDLRCAGAGKAELLLTKDWTADWMHADQWPAQPDGNHSAAILMGGKLPSISSFHSSVTGITIRCFYASMAHPTKSISGISSEAYVEEDSLISRVNVDNPSGCGIGFPGHNGGAAIINGLRMENICIIGPVRRDSVGILMTGHAVNYSLSDFTIAATLYKANSADYAATGQEDPTIYPKPAHILDRAIICLSLAGNGEVSGGHIEGPVIGIRIPQGNPTNSISASNIKFWKMCDANQVWPGDRRGLTTPAPDTAGQYDVSTCVLLDSSIGTSKANVKDSVRLHHIISKGGTNRLLSDIANKEMGNNGIVSSYGHGQFPAQPTGRITEYVRGNAWKPGNYRLVI